MDCRTIFVGLLIIFLTQNLLDAAQFRFTNFVCENANKSWLNVTECRLRAVSRNVTNLYFNTTLLHPVLRDVLVKGQIFKRANGYKPWLYTASIDGCRFLKRPYSPVAIIVYKMFKKHTNLNHTCPIEDYVAVQDFNLNMKNLPHALPTGDYLLRLDWIFSMKLQLTTKHYFEFVEDL